METHHPSERPMTTKANQISTSQRIRDNQRRSRARRKEYIQNLEQRLHRFEVLGVQATQQVQAAGRKVVMENTHLRSLLKLHGVTDQDIQEYLAARSSAFIYPSTGGRSNVRDGARLSRLTGKSRAERQAR
ncbi:hypothetical protein BDV23DRAFT_183837 [Aspergillus alliaceus]|uniref:BZIP domain-containing protein n=1 Tax=Petromyces alliaceus TaxID=209559 RepID=A0A5N7C7M3_PETAA|nr:hypothetical protein BDV23DRAFT_183837 [Aspergillus alliaceus]